MAGLKARNSGAALAPASLYQQHFRKPADIRALHNAIEDEWEVGQLLPIERNRLTGDYQRPGHSGLRVPRVVSNALNAAAAPGKAARGEYALIVDKDGKVLFEGLAEDAAELATTLTMGGEATAPLRGAGLGIFGGAMAKTADKAALKMAQEMAEKGATRKEIWEATGWFKGTDGKWRFEIDDSGASFYSNRLDANNDPFAKDKIVYDWLTKNGYPELKRNNVTGGMMAGDLESVVKMDDYVAARRFANRTAAEDPGVPLGEYMSHPGLYEAYPDMADIPIRREMRPDLRGSYHPEKNAMTTGGGPIGDGNHQAFSTTLHEADHAVAHREGFAPGSNLDDARGLLDDAAWAAEAMSWRRELERLAKDNPNVSVSDLSAMAMQEYKEAGLEVPSNRARSIAMAPDQYPSAALEDTVNRAFTDGLTPKQPGMFHSSDATNAYKREAGEVSARNVQARHYMTAAERRAKAPWETQDVPDERQIIRGKR